LIHRTTKNKLEALAARPKAPVGTTYVENEFRKYLECGGFAHVHCTQCEGIYVKDGDALRFEAAPLCRL
jgi:hypothetical protein